MKRALVLALAMSACSEQKAPQPPPRAQPKPLEPLTKVMGDAGDPRDRLYDVVPLSPVGPPLPTVARFMPIVGETTSMPPGEGPVVLVPDEETFLAQVAQLLATLDDQKQEVWLKHPDAPIGFKLTLRDAAEFQSWIDDPKPGKLRVIHRADGFELQTNMGKLPGGDPNGPTVPLRGGKMDLSTLQRGFEKIQGRFKSAEDVCFAPSFGMELAQVARAMAANYVRADTAFFPETCLVYPRPPKQN